MTPLSVSVDADIDALEDLHGKVVSDLQEDIVFGDEGVTGTLKYISDYSEAFDSGENSGYYLAFHCSTPGVDDAVIMVNSSDEGTVLLDSETGIAICRVTDKDTQIIGITAEKDGDYVNAIIDLSGLTLETQNSQSEPAEPGNNESGDGTDPVTPGTVPEG